MFAKLYDTKEHGQILVKFDGAGEDGPECRFYFQPEIEGVGLCSVAISGKNTAAGEEAIREAFNQQTEASAIAIVSHSKKELEGLTGGGKS